MPFLRLFFFQSFLIFLLIPPYFLILLQKINEIYFIITQKTSVGANDAQYELTGLTNAGDNTFAFVTKTVENVKITVPKTGGMGTTLFTICGASLIVLAGVMFVVLKKKKTSK